MFSNEFESKVIDRLRACPSKTAILSDIDGTLHSIVERPELLQFSDFIPTILEDLAEKYSLVSLVTGRSIDNALGLLKARGVTYVGNHGLEIYDDGQIGYSDNVKNYLPTIRLALDMVRESELGGISGLNIEDKNVAVAVHFRQVPEKVGLVEEVLNKIASELNMKVVKGRKVREIQPPIDVDKGKAIINLLKADGSNLALYMGDDVSDIFAFRRLKEAQSRDFEAITIGIRSREVPEIEEEPAVDYLFDKVDDAIELLHRLV